MRRFVTIMLAVILLGSLTLVPINSSFAAMTITVSLDKPTDEVNKTDNVKIKGYIDGLEAGKTYIIRVQVFEDGGPNYSAPLLKSFSVEAE